jgi:hypothetical protein
MNTVRLQVILNRKVCRVPLGFMWPEALFDRAAGKCLVRLPTVERPANYDQVLDQLVAAVGPDPASVAEHNNPIMGKALDDAHVIYRRYHLADNHPSLAEFMKFRINERYRSGQISENTNKPLWLNAAFFVPRMFRHILPPRLYWVLLIPLAFYLTRSVIIWNPAQFLEYKRISIDDYKVHARDYKFVKYMVCGLSLNARQYWVGQFLANACLVIGAAALSKTWYRRKTSAGLPTS